MNKRKLEYWISYKEILTDVRSVLLVSCTAALFVPPHGIHRLHGINIIHIARTDYCLVLHLGPDI